MRNIGIFLSLLAISASASAQKLDLRSFSDIRQQNVRKNLPDRSRQKRVFSNITSNPGKSQEVLSAIAAGQLLEAEDAKARVMAFITIADGHSSKELEDAGVDVKKVFNNLAIVEVDVEEAASVAGLPCVKAMSLQKRINPTLDKARKESGVDEILSGSPEAGLSVPYTGKGVVAGIVDQGVDPHHINFKYIGGESRISYLAHLRYNSNMSGMAETHYNYENINDFTTDAPSTYHGTHTLGIMAGSYGGPVTVAKPWADPTVPEPAQFITEDCKYYGVAPNADIAVSCGDLADAFIAYGMDYILGYAEYADAPLVYNLSLGSSSGPHDPNSQMAQFLDMIGERSIVCISAGNEGDLKIALKKTFTEDDCSFKTMIFPYNFNYDPETPGSFTARYGSVSIYSDDATPFKLKAVIYNRKRGFRTAMNMPVVGENIGTYYCSSSDYMMDDSDIVGDATFVKAYEGYVGVGGKIDEQTGRYYGMVDFYVINNIMENLDDNYVLGFEVEGVPGQRIECYNDGQTTWLDNYGQEGFTDGSTDGSISDLAVGHNVLVVGSYNTRNNWTCLDGGTSRYDGDGFTPGGVSGFSSYGTLSDGRQLPHVCAPGAAIISSMSWPFMQQVIEQQGEKYADMMCSAKYEDDGRVNYWKQEVGTSMSTPFVAGSIALWLEACPSLTIDQVKEIIAKTSVRDEQVNSTKEQVRWGAGKFNALEGLKEAIRLQEGVGVEGVVADKHNDRLILSKAGENTFKAFVGTASVMNVQVFSIDGRRMLETSCEGDEIIIDLSTLSPGIYVVNVNGYHSQRVAVN